MYSVNTFIKNNIIFLANKSHFINRFAQNGLALDLLRYKHLTATFLEAYRASSQEAKMQYLQGLRGLQNKIYKIYE